MKEIILKLINLFFYKKIVRKIIFNKNINKMFKCRVYLRNKQKFHFDGVKNRFN